MFIMPIPFIFCIFAVLEINFPSSLLSMLSFKISSLDDFQKFESGKVYQIGSYYFRFVRSSMILGFCVFTLLGVEADIELAFDDLKGLKVYESLDPVSSQVVVDQTSQSCDVGMFFPTSVYCCISASDELLAVFHDEESAQLYCNDHLLVSFKKFDVL